MNKEEAINLSRMEIIGTFKVLSVEGLSKVAEENTMIRLSTEDTIGPIQGEGDVDEAEVYYVTLGFDSIQGDGDFKVTCRVVDPMGNELPVRIVDYLALG